MRSHAEVSDQWRGLAIATRDAKGREPLAQDVPIGPRVDLGVRSQSSVAAPWPRWRQLTPVLAFDVRRPNRLHTNWPSRFARGGVKALSRRRRRNRGRENQTAPGSETGRSRPQHRRTPRKDVTRRGPAPRPFEASPSGLNEGTRIPAPAAFAVRGRRLPGFLPHVSGTQGPGHPSGHRTCWHSRAGQTRAAPHTAAGAEPAGRCPSLPRGRRVRGQAGPWTSRARITGRSWLLSRAHGSRIPANATQWR